MSPQHCVLNDWRLPQLVIAILGTSVSQVYLEAIRSHGACPWGLSLVPSSFLLSPFSLLWGKQPPLPYGLLTLLSILPQTRANQLTWNSNLESVSQSNSPSSKLCFLGIYHYDNVWLTHLGWVKKTETGPFSRKTSSGVDDEVRVRGS